MQQLSGRGLKMALILLLSVIVFFAVIFVIPLELDFFGVVVLAFAAGFYVRPIWEQRKHHQRRQKLLDQEFEADRP